MQPVSKYSDSARWIFFPAAGLAIAAGIALAILSRCHVKGIPFKAVYIGSGVSGSGLSMLVLTLIFGKGTAAKRVKTPSPATSSVEITTATTFTPTPPLPPTQRAFFEGPSPKQELSLLFNDWNQDRDGLVVTDETDKRDAKKISQLNLRLMEDMRPHGETPLDFVWAYQHCIMDTPMPLMVEPAIFNPEENRFYRIPFHEDLPTVASGCPLLNPDSEDNAEFGAALKRMEDKLFLYMDGKTNGLTINVDGQSFPLLHGRGGQVPSLELQEDSIIATGDPFAAFLFRVGPNGTILYPDPDKAHPSRPHPQSTAFFALLSREQRAELSDPIEPGFRLSATFSQTADEQDYIIVDPDNDNVLKQLIDYFRREFAVMDYTEMEKHERLALFAFDAFNYTLKDDKIHKDYLLGEFLRGGRGVCRHRALLHKVLADALGLTATFVAAGVYDRTCLLNGGITGHLIPSKPNGAHAWIVATIKVPDSTWGFVSQQWVIDPMRRQAFNIEYIPEHKCLAKDIDGNPDGHPWLEYFYGLRSF